MFVHDEVVNKINVPSMGVLGVFIESMQFEIDANNTNKLRHLQGNHVLFKGSAVQTDLHYYSALIHIRY
jgi:hypothetical protein